MFKLLITVLSLTSIIGVLAHPSLKNLPPDQIETLGEWKTDEKQRMWEDSRKFEGDMILLHQQRNGLVDLRYRWRDHVIPYVLDPVFTEAQANIISDAVEDFAKKSCLTVRKRIDETDYVYVTAKNTGCWSYVGRIGGKQELNLDSNCIDKLTILHEFLHAAGFTHQHTTRNRDDYIIVNWDNIQPGKEDIFVKLANDITTDFGFPYDYGSIMHYAETTASVNGKPTMVPLDESWVGKIGLSPEMSMTDVAKLAVMCTQVFVEPYPDWLVWLAIPLGLLALSAICGGCYNYIIKK